MPAEYSSAQLPHITAVSKVTKVKVLPPDLFGLPNMLNMDFKRCITTCTAQICFNKTVDEMAHKYRLFKAKLLGNRTMGEQKSCIHFCSW